MGLKQIIKKGVSFGFQPKRWLGVDTVARQGKTCVNLLKDLIEPSITPELKAQLAEEAVALQQSAAALTARTHWAKALMAGYTATAFAGLCYTGYLALSKALFLPAAVTFMVSLILIVYAFREFMVYGQIRCGVERLPLRLLIKKLKTLRKASS